MLDKSIVQNLINDFGQRHILQLSEALRPVLSEQLYSHYSQSKEKPSHNARFNMLFQKDHHYLSASFIDLANPLIFE